MKSGKIKIAILFGGKSAEHEVSIQSAKNVYNSLNKKKYEAILIGIDKKGIWHHLKESYLLKSTFAHQKPVQDGREVSMSVKGGNNMVISSSVENFEHIDVVFPVLHGPFGEDGTVQGTLQLMNIPYVGSGVLGSAVGMDKDVAKRLLYEAGIPVAPFLVFRKSEKISFAVIEKKLRLPFFVKPANLGSSIGVSKVHTREELNKAIEQAFLYDTKIIVEQYIEGREIELSVLGNDDPIVSVPGEIVSSHEFYDYDAKYLDENGARLEIPAKMPKDKIVEFQKLAKEVFRTLCLSGMARIDGFFAKNNNIYINEVNTIPGFTNISMYPKLWEASGISYPELVDKLIELAIERYKSQSKLQTSL
jgi:D-alanine-D-alanine ligase